MKILLVAPADGHSNLYLERAFKALGHEVTQLDYRQFQPDDANTRLLTTEKAEYDLTLVLKGENLTPETLSRIHPCVLWNFDLWYRSEPWLLNQIKAVDHFLTPSKGVFQGENVHYMPEAADLEFHRPMSYHEPWAADVAFIGTVSDIPGRDEWLAMIGEWCDAKKKTLKIWGSFPGTKSKKWYVGIRAGTGSPFPNKPVTEDEAHNIIVSSSKIMLDRQRNPEIEGAISARVFRTLAAKGFMIMRHCKGQEELLGLKNGWNCVTYNDDDECLLQIEEALKAEDRYRELTWLKTNEIGTFNERGIQVDFRATIGRHGYETVAARHTWTNRAEEILKLV